MSDITFDVGPVEGDEVTFDAGPVGGDDVSFEVGSGGGFISVIRVPCPSSVMVLAGFAGMVGSGRRRATVRS